MVVKVAEARAVAVMVVAGRVAVLEVVVRAAAPSTFSEVCQPRKWSNARFSS